MWVISAASTSSPFPLLLPPVFPSPEFFFSSFLLSAPVAYLTSVFFFLSQRRARVLEWMKRILLQVYLTQRGE